MQGFRYASPPACVLVHFQRTIGQIPYRSLCFVMPLSNEKMPIGIGQRAVCKERCLLASDNGSQPYRKAFRFFEMAGMGLPLIISACPWVGDMSCPCPLPNGKVLCVGCRSIQPFRRTHRHGCMAGYLCLMPNGISFVKTRL